MIGISRKKRSPDPHLQRKVGLFFAGAAVALVGIALESRIVVGVATLILLAGFALRFLPRGGEGQGEEDDAQGEQDEEADGSVSPLHGDAPGGPP
jgi:hypothetical protein